MRNLITILGLSLLLLTSGALMPDQTSSLAWMPWPSSAAFATGGGGGGENPGTDQFRPRSRSDKRELPLPREVRQLGNLVVRGAAALREANGNIEFLTQLENEVEKLDDLSDARLREAVRDIRNAKKEQQKSRDEIRLGMKEAFAAIGVHLGKRNARASLREIDKARKQAARVERNKDIVKLGKDGLTMIDNARAANAALEAMKSAMNRAISLFK